MLTVYTRNEFFRCLKWSGTKSRYQSVVSAATLRQLGSRYSVEQGRCARRRLYWYNGQSMSTSFARHATLIAGNDTVPVSVWRSRGMRSTKSLCPLVTPPSIGERSIVMSVSICVCVFCPRAYLRNYTSELHQFFVHVTYGGGPVFLWWRIDTLCTPSLWFYKPKLLDVATQLT